MGEGIHPGRKAFETGMVTSLYNRSQEGRDFVGLGKGGSTGREGKKKQQQLGGLFYPGDTSVAFQRGRGGEVVRINPISPRRGVQTRPKGPFPTGKRRKKTTRISLQEGDQGIMPLFGLVVRRNVTLRKKGGGAKGERIRRGKGNHSDKKSDELLLRRGGGSLNPLTGI